MRRKLTLVTAGFLAGATVAMSAPPAQAQTCASTDPVMVFVCHYYGEVGEAAYSVYCKLAPPCR